MDLGERLRLARLGRSPRMTLADLAGDRLSISLISKIERGLVRPSLATLDYLAERLDLPLAELVGDQSADRTDRALALARARAALQNDEPAVALALTERLADGEAALVVVRALLALRRDDEALAALDSLPAGSAEAALLRGEALARSGARDRAQDAFGRALALLRPGEAWLRAEALVGLAGLAEAAGELATARNLLQQAIGELGTAASPARQRAAAAERAEALAAAGDRLGALAAAAAAAELGALTRAAALRGELFGHLPEVGRPPAGRAALTRFREADDQIRHRSIRPPPAPGS